MNQFEAIEAAVSQKYGPAARLKVIEEASVGPNHRFVLLAVQVKATTTLVMTNIYMINREWQVQLFENTFQALVPK